MPSSKLCRHKVTKIGIFNNETVKNISKMPRRGVLKKTLAASMFLFNFTYFIYNIMKRINEKLVRKLTLLCITIIKLFI